MPAYQAYSAENLFKMSVTVSRTMYFTLLYPSCRGTRRRTGPLKPREAHPVHAVRQNRLRVQRVRHVDTVHQFG